MSTNVSQKSLRHLLNAVKGIHSAVLEMEEDLRFLEKETTGTKWTNRDAKRFLYEAEKHLSQVEEDLG